MPVKQMNTIRQQLLYVFSIHLFFFFFYCSHGKPKGIFHICKMHIVIEWNFHFKVSCRMWKVKIDLNWSHYQLDQSEGLIYVIFRLTLHMVYVSSLDITEFNLPCKKCSQHLSGMVTLQQSIFRLTSQTVGKMF